MVPIIDCRCPNEGEEMTGASPSDEKVAWSGRLVAARPRIRLIRPFDERRHGYQRYVLRVQGMREVRAEPTGGTIP